MISEMVGPTPDQNSKNHVPVMLYEVLDALQPCPGEVHVDGTFGAGGYSAAILKSGASVIAIDRDPSAIAGGRKLVIESHGSLALHHGRFSELDEISRASGNELVDGVVLDVGVSSMQLDQAQRGFSFRSDGPLDMRMAQRGVSAADVVNQIARSDLTRIIGILGEEKKAGFVAKAIETERQKQAILTTAHLAKVVEMAVGRKPGDKIHPATRTFQALRIFVNRELEELAKALFAAERILNAGGRLVVVTFHSLEDRIVKRFLADRSGASQGSRHLPQREEMVPTFGQQRRSAQKASLEECQENPRSRSAKLRTGVRLSADARQETMEIFGLPNLADLGSIQSAGIVSGGACA